MRSDASIVSSKSRAQSPKHAIQGDAALLRGGSAEFSRALSYLTENLRLRLVTLTAGLHDAGIIKPWSEGRARQLRSRRKGSTYCVKP